MSVVEQSCVVCNENLSKQNEKELERVQKVAVKLLSGKYELYSEALKSIGIKTLKERRNMLCNRFAKKCAKKTKKKKHV